MFKIISNLKERFTSLPAPIAESILSFFMKDTSDSGNTDHIKCLTYPLQKNKKQYFEDTLY